MKNKTLTRERLRELLNYDPETGVFTRRVARSGRAVGSEAGSLDTRGHRQIRVDGPLYLAHRLVWFYVYGKWPADEIDHINQRKDDNRIANLRVVDKSTNQRNAQLRKDNTSGFTGVHWSKQHRKWWVSLQVHNKQIFIGLFKSKTDAIAARKAANKEYGFHENHGKKLSVEV